MVISLLRMVVCFDIYTTIHKNGNVCFEINLFRHNDGFASYEWVSNLGLLELMQCNKCELFSFDLSGMNPNPRAYNKF